MLQALWGEIKTGRLQRLPYLGYFALLNVSGVLLFAGLLMSIDAEQSMLDGTMEQLQASAAEGLSMPVALLGAILMLLFLFASLNIMAKRLRDIGLPGWWSTLGVALVGALLAYLLSEPFGSAFQSLVMLALFLIPSGSLKKQQTLSG